MIKLELIKITIKPGHIRIIKNKVYFVPKGLEKPIELDYWGYGKDRGGKFYKSRYEKALKAHEASKKTVEVSNNYSISALNSHNVYVLINEKIGYIKLKNNQPCEAEITDNKATIIRLRTLKITNQSKS